MNYRWRHCHPSSLCIWKRRLATWLEKSYAWLNHNPKLGCHAHYSPKSRADFRFCSFRQARQYTCFGLRHRRSSKNLVRKPTADFGCHCNPTTIIYSHSLCHHQEGPSTSSLQIQGRCPRHLHQELGLERALGHCNSMQSNKNRRQFCMTLGTPNYNRSCNRRDLDTSSQVFRSWIRRGSVLISYRERRSRLHPSKRR